MRLQVRRVNFRPATLKIIEQARVFIAEYSGALSARQLYYRFVANELIENSKRSYSNMTSIITDARYAGLIGWDDIEDRVRRAAVPWSYDGTIEQLVASAVDGYRVDRAATQPNYVELWCEKDALSNVLAPLADEHHVTFMVNRGYSSASAMFDSASRILRAVGMRRESACKRCGCADYFHRAERGHRYEPGIVASVTNSAKVRPTFILYCGDHDPSGLDMVRDINARLCEFGVANLTVERVALTRAQINRFKPPPNPAKITDSRSKEYIAEHGRRSWELDALRPPDLAAIVREALANVMDLDALEAERERENVERERYVRSQETPKPSAPKAKRKVKRKAKR